jgi:hypothetical protein
MIGAFFSGLLLFLSEGNRQIKAGKDWLKMLYFPDRRYAFA